MSGTFLAQLIPVLVSPLLTRWYEPQDFGVLAVFIALTAVIATVATGKYELAMPLPDNEECASMLVLICTILSALTSLIVLAAIILFYDTLKGMNNMPDTGYWLWLLAPSVLFFGTYQGLNYWHLRQQLYGRISRNRVAQSITNAGLSLGLAKVLVNSVGLIIGELVSRILVTLSHLKSFFYRTSRIRFSKVELFVTAKKYRNCPYYLVPAGLLNISSKQIPILIFSYLINPEFVGYLLLAQRVIQTPLGVISGALSEVLLQRTAEEFRAQGHCKHTYRKMALMLSIGAAIPLIAFYYIAPNFLVWIFGENWADLGDFVRILLPFYYIYFISGTLNIVVISSGKQKINLFMQMLYAIFTLSSIYIGYLLGTERAMLIMFALGSSVYFVIALAFSYYISNGSRIR